MNVEFTYFDCRHRCDNRLLHSFKACYIFIGMETTRDKKQPDLVDDSCQTFIYNPLLVEKIKGELGDVSAAAILFKTLGDESRCTILLSLGRSSELCVCDLSEITGLAMPTVSHHLRKLREQGLVAFRREGKLAFYRLIDEDTRLLLRIAATRGLAPTS